MSVFDLDFDSYKASVLYPDRPRKPSAVGIHTAEDARHFGDEMGDYEKAMDEYRARADEYRKADNEAMARFHADVLKAAGLVGHPKADKVFAMAWDEGHASGLSEVATWVDKLADLVK